ALGYLGAGGSSPLGNLNPTSGIDPKVGLASIYPRITEAMKQQEQNVTGAARIYQNLLIEVPDDLLSLQGLAACQIQLGQIDEAEKNLKRLVSRHPEMQTTWLNLAICAMTQERWQDAIVFLRRELAIDPTAIPALDLMSQCHEKLGQFAEARTE